MVVEPQGKQELAEEVTTMTKGITEGAGGQGTTWEMLEAEVTALLGRCRSQRDPQVDASARYRNSRGEPRRLTVNRRTMTPRRPWWAGADRRHFRAAR